MSDIVESSSNYVLEQREKIKFEKREVKIKYLIRKKFRPFADWMHKLKVSSNPYYWAVSSDPFDRYEEIREEGRAAYSFASFKRWYKELREEVGDEAFYDMEKTFKKDLKRNQKILQIVGISLFFISTIDMLIGTLLFTITSIILVVVIFIFRISFGRGISGSYNISPEDLEHDLENVAETMCLIAPYKKQRLFLGSKQELENKSELITFEELEKLERTVNAASSS